MNCSEFDQMLDLYIDGELDEAQRALLEAHASQCSDCRKKLNASEQLRDILSHMNDDISVPLSAQAAWRNAVRAEAKRSRMKHIYSAIGAVAAVCVLTLGVTAMLRPGATELPTVQRIEADGISESAGIEESISLVSAKTRSVEYIEREIAAKDPAQAYEYLVDAIAEYGATVERETDGDEKKVFLQVSGENAVDFISTVDSLGMPADENPVAVDEFEAMIGICVIITGA